MPIHEYTCKACETKFEKLHRTFAEEKVKCPECGSTKTTRELSSFAVQTPAPATSCPMAQSGACSGGNCRGH